MYANTSRPLKQTCRSGLIAALGLCLALYLPQALAVIVGVRIATPQDPVHPGSLLSGSLQLYTQRAGDPAPVALGSPRAVSELAQGASFAVDVQAPTDPVAPPDLLYSFSGTVFTGSGSLTAQGAPGDPILPQHPTDPIAPVLLGPLAAGASYNVVIVAWDSSGPFVAGNVTTALTAEPTPADLMIDNFRSGALDFRSRNCGVIDATKSGTMTGGTRRTRLIVTDPAANCAAQNPLNQPGTLEVPRNGPLVVGGGLKTFPRLELSYGQSLTNATTPLNLNLAGYDRFRVTFTASDVPVNFNLVLWTHLNETSQSIASCAINVLPGSNTYSVDLPFAKFASGSPSAPDFRDVDFLFFVLQSGSAIGANDFAVRSIIATSGGMPGVATCGN